MVLPVSDWIVEASISLAEGPMPSETIWKLFSSFFGSKEKKYFCENVAPSNWMKKHDVWNGLIRFRKFHVFRHEQTWTIISKTCFSRVSRVPSSTTFFIWARQNVIESKWNSWSLVWPGNSILEQKIVHVIASYLAIHMKILEKCVSHKCFLLLWFIGGKKLKWILKFYSKFIQSGYGIPDTTSFKHVRVWDQKWRSMDPWTYP